MNNPLRLLLLSIPGLFGSSLLAQPPLIATGWDSPTPAEFRQHVADFEKWGVFDGTNIKPTRQVKDRGEDDAQYAFSREPWKWEEFAGALADLQAAKPTTCRETFLTLYANPGDVDWFDDAGWKEIVDHWRLLARLAKQGGLRGLLYDAEPYRKPHSQFRYSAQDGRARHSFAEYCTKARQRGREVMQAVTQEFPDATILTYRLFSDLVPLLDSGNVQQGLQTETYGLQPAFIDGWLDVLPPGLTIVEGTESVGYRANSRAAYQAAFTMERLRLMEFVSPEHRELFARRLRIGQSLYLDAYINPPGDPYHIDSTGSSAAGRLAANVASALAASDGIVWLYGEQGRWWSGGNGKSKPWPEKFPGAVSAISRAKDPAAFARAFFNSKTPRTNLLTNGDFSKSNSAGTAPDGWFTWQEEGSHGTFICKKGSLVIRGADMATGGLIVETKPGVVLAARLRVRTAGTGVGALEIGWKTGEGKWTAYADNVRFYPASPADADGWREITALMEVPSIAGQIVFMAYAGGQFDPDDRCEFADAELVALPPDGAREP